MFFIINQPFTNISLKQMVSDTSAYRMFCSHIGCFCPYIGCFCPYIGCFVRILDVLFAYWMFEEDLVLGDVSAGLGGRVSDTSVHMGVFIDLCRRDVSLMSLPSNAVVFSEIEIFFRLFWFVGFFIIKAFFF